MALLFISFRDFSISAILSKTNNVSHNKEININFNLMDKVCIKYITKYVYSSTIIEIDEVIHCVVRRLQKS